MEDCTSKLKGVWNSGKALVERIQKYNICLDNRDTIEVYLLDVAVAMEDCILKLNGVRNRGKP